jgi:hypothetical protein
MRRVAGKAGRFLFAVLFGWTVAQAANISISGSWSRVIEAADLQAGPGSDLTATYTSATNQITMSVTTTANWRVEVRRIDTVWHADFVLSIRRTNSGTSGPGTVNGGAAYLPITTTDQTFVTGNRTLWGITLQEQLGGVSISIPPGTYTTTVQYTVADI